MKRWWPITGRKTKMESRLDFQDPSRVYRFSETIEAFKKFPDSYDRPGANILFFCLFEVIRSVLKPNAIFWSRARYLGSYRYGIADLNGEFLCNYEKGKTTHAVCADMLVIFAVHRRLADELAISVHRHPLQPPVPIPSEHCGLFSLAYQSGSPQRTPMSIFPATFNDTPRTVRQVPSESIDWFRLQHLPRLS